MRWFTNLKIGIRIIIGFLLVVGWHSYSYISRVIYLTQYIQAGRSYC
jgi:hypothetical protein